MGRAGHYTSGVIARLTRKFKVPRWGMGLAIGLLAWLLSLIFMAAAPGPAGRANDLFYDVFYRLRPETDMRHAEVVLVAADQDSLTAVNQRFNYGWPWPREFWGDIATYLDKAGARALVFDIIFAEKSAYSSTGDDDTFTDALKAIKTPIIFGSEAKPPVGAATAPGSASGPSGVHGVWEHFAPDLKNPIFGAVNIGNDKISRSYPPTVYGLPAQATSTLRTLGEAPKVPTSAPFLLHYYGPHQRKDGKTTFPFIKAAAVLGAQLDAAKGMTYDISADMFKGKIVILCGTAAGTFDLKTSPLSDIYPGAEVQATAIENMLRGDRVWPVAGLLVALLGLVLAEAVSTGVIVPRKALLKMLAPALGAAVLFGIAIGLFRAGTIHWLPPVQPLLAMVLATPLAFAWTYFAEDRQRRFMLKALSKVVSPAVAEQLSRDPGRLARETMRADLTLLFTDLANFTDLSEGMDVQQLGQFMNRYLGEMSDQVLAQDGTLDKYIGDAIMCFWNAPLPQADHAARACRAALRMVERERDLQEEFSANGTRKVYTRIGINTASVAVGFIGSDHLFNYTALGDGVNLASRLEGANKLYGTRILLSANTAALVQGAFWLRQVDVLRVKGKKEPMAVYQLLGERAAGDPGKHGPLVEGYEKAFAAYRERRWDDAERLLLELCGSFGEDGPAEALLARVREYRTHPPDDAWDGVYVSKSK
jgi:adenylate cyclase